MQELRSDHGGVKTVCSYALKTLTTIYMSVACPESCGILFDIPCPRACYEGCQCDSEYMQRGNGCIKAEKCCCFYHGYYYDIGEISGAEGCSEQCNYSTPHATMSCEPASCPEGQRCTLNNTWGCARTAEKDQICENGETCVVQSQPQESQCWLKTKVLSTEGKKAMLGTSQGEAVDATTFGWSWRVPDQEAHCTADCGDSCPCCSAEELIEKNGACQWCSQQEYVLSPQNPFCLCQEVVNYTKFSTFVNIFDLCSSNNLQKAQCWRPMLLPAKMPGTRLESGGTAPSAISKFVLLQLLHPGLCRDLPM